MSLFKRIYRVFYPIEPTLSPNPLRFGILGAANIAPIALVLPIKNHSDAVVYAVAARDQKRADAFAKKWEIIKAYGGAGAYQELLNDPEVDVVYNPLPNGLHYEWTMKALAAGKHVLLEKPSADTAEETQRMFDYAEKKGLVLLEAFHYRFYPATRRAREIIEIGELGTITTIETNLALPRGFIPDTDIRLKFDLGGGAMMDMGCYTLSIARYLAGSDPIRVISASADTASAFPKIDLGTNATLAFPPPTPSATDSAPAEITATMKIYAHVVGTKGQLHLFNFAGPYLYHYITVKSTNDQGITKTRTEKKYGHGWSTYRYQLEAFIDKVRGRTPDHWYDAQDSITNMKWIERVYEATDLGLRPASTAQVPTD